MAYFSLAGEGALDLLVARKIVAFADHQVFAQYDKGGKNNLDRNLKGYMNASRVGPWLILRDLDQDACPLAVLDSIAADRVAFPNCLLRICIRSVESWLLADKAGFSLFFGVSSARIPPVPDALQDSKGALLDVVSHARNRNLRDGVLPRNGSGRRVGPEYNAVMAAYVEGAWSVQRARANSDSLHRAVASVESWQPTLG